MIRHKPALCRLEHVIEVLAACHDRRGFVLDQGRGAARLPIAGVGSAGEPEEEDEEDEEDDDSLIDFIAASGQSADWVLFGDSGVMICKLAAGTLRSDPDSGSKWR